MMLGYCVFDLLLFDGGLFGDEFEWLWLLLFGMLIGGCVVVMLKEVYMLFLCGFGFMWFVIV